jgi:hypothetical protein
VLLLVLVLLLLLGALVAAEATAVAPPTAAVAATPPGIAELLWAPAGAEPGRCLLLLLLLLGVLPSGPRRRWCGMGAMGRADEAEAMAAARAASATCCACRSTNLTSKVPPWVQEQGTGVQQEEETKECKGQSVWCGSLAAARAVSAVCRSTSLTSKVPACGCVCVWGVCVGGGRGWDGEGVDSRHDLSHCPILALNRLRSHQEGEADAPLACHGSITWQRATVGRHL